MKKAECRMRKGERRMENTKTERDLAARTKAFALRIIKMYSALSRSTGAQVLGKQVLRSGTAIGANYREATRGRSRAEFVAKMGDCLKELDETAYWLELLVEAGIVSSKRLAPLQDETNQLIAIFVTILKRTKGKR
jgi:four helix bundle protein